MKIMIVTDAWKPQVNGVVRTLQTTARELQGMGHTVDFLTPLEFSTLPCPTYPDIRLSLFPRGKVVRRLSGFDPDALHIATEGPLGMAARRFALSSSSSFGAIGKARWKMLKGLEFLSRRLPLLRQTRVTWVRPRSNQLDLRNVVKSTTPAWLPRGLFVE